MQALVMFVAPFIGFPRKIDIFGAFAQKCRQCNFCNTTIISKPITHSAVLV